VKSFSLVGPTPSDRATSSLGTPADGSFHGIAAEMCQLNGPAGGAARQPQGVSCRFLMIARLIRVSLIESTGKSHKQEKRHKKTKNTNKPDQAGARIFGRTRTSSESGSGARTVWRTQCDRRMKTAPFSSKSVAVKTPLFCRINE